MQGMGLILNKGVGRFDSFGSEFDQKTNGFFFSNVAFGQNFQGGWVKSKFQAGENNSL